MSSDVSFPRDFLVMRDHYCVDNENKEKVIVDSNLTAFLVKQWLTLKIKLRLMTSKKDNALNARNLLTDVLKKDIDSL